MIGDYFIKPLQGQQFIRFRDMIMGVISDMTEEHVGESGTDNTTNDTDNGKQVKIAKTDNTFQQSVIRK
jgi:hypothetical protein